jgi:hypothetical protein
MVTTNLPLESRAEVLGSEPLTGELVDRPTHRVYIIEATYEGNCLRQSGNRSESQSGKSHPTKGKEENLDR